MWEWVCVDSQRHPFRRFHLRALTAGGLRMCESVCLDSHASLPKS